MAPMEENLQRGIIKQAEKEEGLNRNLKHNTRLKFQGGGLKMKALKIKNWYRRAKKKWGKSQENVTELKVFPLKGPSTLATKRAIYQCTARNVRKLQMPNTIQK